LKEKIFRIQRTRNMQADQRDISLGHTREGAQSMYA